MIKKPMSLKSEIKLTDTVYSTYVRLKDADKNGFVYCVSCGVRKHYKEMDAGHYVSRTHMSLRFDDRNVHPQCQKCNRFKNGMMDEYAIWLMNRYDVDILTELAAEKLKIKQWHESELKAMRKELRLKIKEYGNS